MQYTISDLIASLSVSVQTNVPLSNYSTMRVGGNADYFIEPESIDQMVAVLSDFEKAGQPYLLLGNGSNTVFSDDGLRIPVIHAGHALAEVTVTGNRMIAGAGALLSSVSKSALEHSLTGLEFASGIPGSVGGAVCMNAGAYGGEMAQVLRSVTVFAGGQVQKLPVDQLHLGYRSSEIIRQKWVVLSAELELQPGDPAAISAVMNDLNNRRRQKQPLRYPSCGSFFKRPEGYFAGALIEQAGLKGYQIGGAQISDLHAGFVINAGEATAADIYRLMRHVQTTVKERFSVDLEPEVRLEGTFEL